MSPPRYLIAKYIPDLGRMEPRNIGVIAWAGGAVEARFLAERVARPGSVNGQSLPSFVRSLPAYKQWVAFWRTEMDRPAIRPIEGGAEVSRDAPEFLDVLAGSGRGNYVLADAGTLLDPITPDELPFLVDHLYHVFVEVNGPEEAPDQTLDKMCERVIKASGLLNDPHLRLRHVIDCPVGKGVDEAFEFSYSYNNGVPRAIYQRLPLSDQPKRLKKDVNDAAWKFSKVIQACIVPEERCGVLIHPSADREADPDVQQALKVIRSVTRVLDLNDFDSVRDEFARLPLLLDH